MDNYVITHMKKLVLLFVTCLVFSCVVDDDYVDDSNPGVIENPDNPENPADPGVMNLSSSRTEVTNFEYIEVASNNTTFLNEVYVGKFGTHTISLVKSGENKLTFFIPNLPNGEYVLKLSNNGKEGEKLFKISSPEDLDELQIIETEIEAPLNLMNSIIGNLLDHDHNTDENSQLLASAQLMFESFTSKFEELSSDQKNALAKFFKVNPVLSKFTEDLNRNSQKSTLAIGKNCFEENFENLNRSQELIEEWERISPVIAATDSEGFENAGVILTTGSYLASVISFNSQNQLVNYCKKPVSNILIDEANQQNDSEFTNGDFKSFEIKTAINGMSSIDKTTNSNISSIANQMDENSNKWGNYIEETNSILNSDWFKNWYSLNSSFKIVPNNIANLPDSSEETIIDGNAEYIKITNLPSGVEAIYEKNGNNIKIKLNASPSILPLDFNAKISYDDGYFKSENNLKGVIRGKNYNYQLEIGYYNVDQSITTEKVLFQGDELTMPNNMSKYIRLTLDGEPINPFVTGGWHLWHFGDLNDNPTSTDDILIEDYEIDLPDYLNGGSAIIKIDLTLSNQALRYLTQNEFEISEYMNGELRQGPFKIKHSLDGKWVLEDYSTGSITTGPYEIIFGHFSHEEQCHNYVFKTETIGTYRTGGYNIHAAPTFMYVLEDGNLRTNVSPYGCPANGYGWFIKKL
jgi:hypothetical protein